MYPLMPPGRLIIENGIGVDSPATVEVDFDNIGRELVEEMIAAGLIAPEDAVLDVGCGLGRLARHLAPYLRGRGKYVGVDVTRSSIEWCGPAYRDLPHFHFLHVDVFNTHYNPGAALRAADYRFPMASGTFDVVFSTSLFTHMTRADAAAYLADMARLLRPGGRMWHTYLLLDAVSEPLTRAVEARPEIHMTHEVDGGLVANPADPEALIGFRTEVVEQMYADSGLAIDEIRLGRWSGRGDSPGNYQDIVIATRIP